MKFRRLFPPRAFFVASLSLLLLAAVPAVAEEDAAAPTTLAELEEDLRTVLRETGLPGVGFVVLTPQTSWVGGVGMSDVETGRPVGPDTVFRLGSISKTFVSLAALKLQEEGRLDLNALVRDLAPLVEFSNPYGETDPVRVVHLLEHTAGFDDIHLAEYAASDPDLSLEEGLAFHPDSRTVRWRPGERFAYSNSGPAVAALVIEKVTGQRFEDYVRVQFLDPLMMKSASYFPDERVRNAFAIGYRSDGVTPVPYRHILMRPAGSLNASPNDMINFLQFMLNRGLFREIPIITEASIRRMETPKTTLAARQGVLAGYGCGNFTRSHEGFLFHGHDGGIDGFGASFGYSPEHGVAYAYMINGEIGEAHRRIGKILRTFVTRDLELDIPFEATPSAETLQALAGYYVDIAPRQQITQFLLRLVDVKKVRVEDGRLQVGVLFGKPTPLVAVTDTHFRRENDPIATIVFLENEDGTRLAQGWGWPLQGTYRRVSSLVVWGQLLVALVAITLMASSVGFAVIWFPRWLFRRLRDVKHLDVRMFPFLASVSFFLATLLFWFGRDLPFEKLGRPTFWSLGFYLSTLIFAVTSVYGLIKVYRARNWEIARGIWVHSGLVCLFGTVLTGYLVYWGIIGLRTWAY